MKISPEINVHSEQALIEDSPDLMALLDPSGSILSVNHRFEQLIDPGLDGCLGKPLLSLFPDNGSLAKLEKLFAQVSNGQQVTEEIYFVHTEDKRQHAYLARLYPVSDAIGNYKLIGFSATDITPYHESRQALKKQSSDLALAQRIGNMGSWEWNLHSQELEWSDETYRIYGVDRSDTPISTELFVSIIHPDDRDYVMKKLEQAVTTFEFHDLYYRVVRKNDQKQRFIHVIPSLERDMEGNPLRLFGIVHDITEQKKAEQEKLELQNTLQLAQRMEALGKLTSGIAHDFNNLLSCIRAYNSIIKKSVTDTDSKVNNAIDQISTSCVRGNDMLSQLLIFAREGTIVTKQQELDVLVQEFVKLVTGMMPGGIKIETKLDTRLPPVQIDQTQLSQILMNLCINARDAMNEKGTISIELALHKAYSGVCSSCHEPMKEDYVRLIVSDDGEGISAEGLENIFEPFYSSKESGKGTGLGLSTVHGLMHQHGGHIIVDSIVGKGTRFQLFFPIFNQNY